MNRTLPLDCADLLPHRPPMRLAGSLVHHEPERVTLLAPIPEDGLFVNAEGMLDPVALVELAAQGAAALKGYESKLRGEPVRIGYLAGIRDFQVTGEARAGEELTILAVQEFAMEQAALVRGEIRCGERLVAGGTVKVWEEREWPALPQLDDLASAASPLPPLEPGSMDVSGADPIGRGLARALQGLEPAATENQVVGWFCFGEDFPGFRGHFPGYPILPAVVMPRLALALAAARLGRLLRLRAIESAKITQAVFPGMPVCVQVTLSPEYISPAQKLKAKLTSLRGPVATYNMVVDCPLTLNI